jgi:hypothetical protein
VSVLRNSVLKTLRNLVPGSTKNVQVPSTPTLKNTLVSLTGIYDVCSHARGKIWEHINSIPTIVG